MLKSSRHRGTVTDQDRQPGVHATFLWRRYVDHSVDHGHRSIESDCSAIERGYHCIAGARERDSSGSNDGARHGASACPIDRRRAAHLPKYVLGLRSVNQDDAARKSWSTHNKRRGHLEDPDGVRVALGVESEVRPGDRERTARRRIRPGSDRESAELTRAWIGTCGLRHKIVICGQRIARSLRCDRKCYSCAFGGTRTGRRRNIRVDLPVYKSRIGPGDCVITPCPRIMESGYQGGTTSGPEISIDYSIGPGVGYTGAAPERPKSRDRSEVGSSRVDLQACKLEYSIVSPK